MFCNRHCQNTNISISILYIDPRSDNIRAIGYLAPRGPISRPIPLTIFAVIATDTTDETHLCLCKLMESWIYGILCNPRRMGLMHPMYRQTVLCCLIRSDLLQKNVPKGLPNEIIG